ncbi:hypothetical protein EOA79_31635 [Mesorhizobium sp. M1A.F.Ca.IN.020.03.2.1]|uniref:hypothetical protein n=1 Tax=unclassified Mesorhizobium TaxID=325217 RepID=UPI000FCC26F4|nr:MULTISPECIES: hypothetical protein [unclassified Mesorhizobium]RUU94149.1 hypothetical protein EOA79_31635 [Mesorhizobium sp. M1A.F.Ca.IN.020.03.2.1]RUV84763.1 hypothetical protein EOA51_20695 [Mesorhizobium sp. M1A.F.Ca.IN.020.32.1.1]RUW07141.1 hypothetical protein EOA46_24350 [Mesorhizobium sp. M1A.F.Ca.IN.022.05.2.1]RWF80053.1 MAG: hypothetical protein EOQ35_19405 [Mesorhizobium sp.]RWG03631.1 MAG: hypothetical protein EOQ38_07835 [Mesorhizobium sp.]
MSRASSINVPENGRESPKLAVDFTLFALFLEARRIHRGKSPTRVAREADVEVDAVYRAARGRDPGADEFLALCAWIGEEPSLFLKKEARHGQARCL